MRKEPPLPQELWDTIPPEAQLAVLALVERFEQTIARLEQRVAELEARLQQNSQNSSRPPSSDSPAVKRRPPDAPSGKKRGAQPGHDAHQRVLLPPERVQRVVPCRPTHCRRCRSPLAGDDAQPLRHQVVELPPVELDVIEYQLHRLHCPQCGSSTCADLPPGVPRGQFGPRLVSVLSLLSGVYRMSKRKVEDFCWDVLGVSVSLGQVSQLEQTTAAALDAPVAEARAYVQDQPSCGMDETGWREQRQRAWLWTMVTQCVTVFVIRLSRGGKVARELLGECFRGTVSSDRWSGYNWLPLLRRQLCWAHLRRDFQAMIDRGGAAALIGRKLLGHSDSLFTWWHRVRDGTLARSTFQSYVLSWLRAEFRNDLGEGTRCACSKTAATCRELEKLEPALWTFVRHEGIEPTNNASERTLRHAVQWRKTSYGTDSAAGSHFVENILTVVATCRQQGRHVLDYLTSCCRAATCGTPAPSLLPSAHAADAA